MSDTDRRTGAMAWIDLTVDHADEIRDFYVRVVGWQPSEVPLGDYSDYGMHCPSDNTMAAGICHARGVNEGLPPVWLPYVNVEDIEQSMQACREQGGKVINGPRGMGGGSKVVVIQDPAGAYLALFQQG